MNQNYVTKTSSNEENLIKTLIDNNNNLRKNILLSLEIYKTIINFDHKYIHTLNNDYQ
jgi:hypothetical protein